MSTDFHAFNALIRTQVVEGLDCRDLLKQQGFITGSITRNRVKARCPYPWHEDKTPSCSVEKTSFRCFGCNKGGDVLNLIEMFWGIEGFHKQLAWGCQRLGLNYESMRDDWLRAQSLNTTWQPRVIDGGVNTPPVASPSKPPVLTRAPTTSEVWLRVVRAFDLDQSAAKYLTNRGVSVDVARARGVVSAYFDQWDEQINRVALELGEQAIVDAGLRGSSGNSHPYLNHMLIFIYHNGQDIEGLRFRTLNPNPTHYYGARYLAPTGSHNDVRTPWGADFNGLPLMPTHLNVLYVVEGQLDALILIAGGRCAIATGGASKFRSSWVVGWKKFDHVVVLSDAGDAGSAMEVAVFESVEDTHGTSWADEHLSFSQVSAPGCTDVNDMYNALILEAHLLQIELNLKTKKSL